jgi:hypothetical protein
MFLKKHPKNNEGLRRKKLCRNLKRYTVCACGMVNSACGILQPETISRLMRPSNFSRPAQPLLPYGNNGRMPILSAVPRPQL